MSHPPSTLDTVIERVEVTSYGRPATEALADAVGRARAGAPLAAVTVVVASNLAGLTVRRLLGSGEVGPGGLAGVDVVTPFRLAELLAGDGLRGRLPLTDPILGAAVRTALAATPGPLAAVADHAATEAAMIDLYRELSDVSAEGLSRLRRRGGPVTAAAVEVVRAVAARLDADYHDEADVAAAATGRLTVPEVVAPLGTVLWHLPGPTTPGLVAMMAAVVRAAPAEVVVGLTGDAAADAAVAAVCRRAGVEVSDVRPPPAPTGSAIVSVTDPDDEVRTVVRKIVEHAEAGVRLDRMGVFYPVADPYVRLLGQHLAAAGVPANGPSQQRLADSVAGRTLLAALDLPGQRWRRDRVMALVSGGPVLHDGEAVRPATWEALSRRAGVVAGLADWHRKLDGRRRGLARAAEGHDPGSAAAAAVERERADLASLDAFVTGVADRVTAVSDARGWAGAVGAATDLLHALLGPGRRRDGWPEAEVAAAERVEDALARLSVLDRIEGDPAVEVFRRALVRELDGSRGRDGRFGDGVVYGPLVGAPGHDLDAIFVVGLVEGRCPAPRRDHPLIPDTARAELDGELPIAAEALHDQHRHLLAALAAAPPSRRILTAPRGDLRGGREALPSRWLLDTASALAGRTVYATEFAGLGAPVVDVVPSHAAGVVDAAAPVDLAERDVGVLARHVRDGGSAVEHALADLVGRGLAAQAGRSSPAFTGWDGNLAGLVVPSPATGAPMSPTGLERWAGCGFRYLLGSVLGLAERDDPTRIVDLSPIDRGSALHAVLERFVGEVIDAGGIAPATPWSATQRARAGELVDEVLADYEARGRTGRPLRWALTRTQLALLVDDFLTHDDAVRATLGSRPSRVELAFGLDDRPPVEVEVTGRRVSFRGRIDRVDEAGPGRFVVSDYKTGKGGYEKLAKDPVDGGTTLQLGVYAEAVRQHLGADEVDVAYWMVNPDARYARRGYAWEEPQRQRFTDVVGGIVEGIEAGAFPMVPGEWSGFHRSFDNCRYCEFDRVCPADRDEQAERKRAAPELAVRAVLAAGEPAS